MTSSPKKPSLKVKKAALAYSGGLDTSIIIPWLRETYGCEVVAVAVDVGQAEETSGLREKALATGASAFHLVDARDELAKDYLFPVLKAGAVYEHEYLLGTATARGNTNLEPQTTISYQLGVQHLVNQDLFFQFGVYFKDVFGLLTTVPREVPGFATTVQTYVNGDYASERGLEFSLTRRFKRGFGFELNYGYGYANGTASDPERALPERGNLRDQFKPNTEQPLRWDQRHTFSATLSLADENVWRTSFVYQFGSGFPYTPHVREERRQDPALVYSTV